MVVVVGVGSSVSDIIVDVNIINNMVAAAVDGAEAHQLSKHRVCERLRGVAAHQALRLGAGVPGGAGSLG